MDRPRPQILTVMAILNFVFGALFLMCGLCGALGTIGGPAIMQGIAKSAPPQPGGGNNPLADMSGMFDAVPGYYPVNICSSVLGVTLSILLIVAGVGLLKVEPWARWACLGYAVAVIILQLVMFVYSVAVVQPATDKWMRDFMAKQGQVQPPGASVGGTAGGIIGGCFGLLFSIAYPVALLVVMMLPQVVVAFQRPGDEGSRAGGPSDPYRR